MEVEAVSRFLGVLAIAAGPGSLLLLAARRSPALAAVRQHALWLAAAVAVTATAGSLYYSEIVGFVPCELCWWQRIAMYSLAPLLTLAALRRDGGIRPYAQLLGGLGLAVSVWHVLVQRVPSIGAATSCAADSPCTARWVEVFGVLSIPVMAGFGFIAVVVLTGLAQDRPTRPGGHPGTSDTAPPADRATTTDPTATADSVADPLERTSP